MGGDEMFTGSLKSMGVAAAAAGLILAAAACNSSNDVTAPPTGGGGSSNLVVSASSPADGDGTLTDSATLTVNAGSTGFDELDLSQTLGAIGHEVVVTWDTNTHAINAVQHFWGNGSVTSGITQCLNGTNTCDPAKVSVDFAGHKVTFSGLVLDDALGGSTTSTLTGTIVW
jgi:hypothetical protein